MVLPDSRGDRGLDAADAPRGAVRLLPACIEEPCDQLRGLAVKDLDVQGVHPRGPLLRTDSRLPTRMRARTGNESVPVGYGQSDLIVDRVRESDEEEGALNVNEMTSPSSSETPAVSTRHSHDLASQLPS